MTVDVAKRVPLGHVTAVKVAPKPLDAARALDSSKGVSNISYQVGDIHDLPFPDNAFDLVHAHQVLQHIADLARAFQEMRRGVKPGEIVAVREYASLTWYPDSEGITAWHEMGERMVRVKGGNPHPGSFIHTRAKEGAFG